MTDTSSYPFVIQEHNTPDGGHWDLMLQFGEVLWTWRLHHPPGHIHDIQIPAEKIFDHPLRFLSYEGPVQNFTSTVKITDAGTFTLIRQTDKEIEFQASGKILTGTFLLYHKQEDTWFLSKIR